MLDPLVVHCDEPAPAPSGAHVPLVYPSNAAVFVLYRIIPLTGTLGRFAAVSRGTMIALDPVPVRAMSNPPRGELVPIPTLPPAVIRIFSDSVLAFVV